MTRSLRCDGCGRERVIEDRSRTTSPFLFERPDPYTVPCLAWIPLHRPKSAVAGRHDCEGAMWETAA
jgi:hypothetical protein